MREEKLSVSSDKNVVLMMEGVFIDLLLCIIPVGSGSRAGGVAEGDAGPGF